MGLLDKLLGRTEQKAADLPFVQDIGGWRPAAWLDPSFNRMAREGYHANSVVFACVSVLAMGYAEPPPVVKDREGELALTHPLQRLLDRPNPVMSHAELQKIIMVYKAVGGNAYLHIIRNKSGLPIELWPYNAAQLSPVASPYGWVEAYEYSTNGGTKRQIPASDVIHLKWPSVDLEQPILALPPLRAVAREVDADNEMTRMVYALLVNDGAPRSVLSFPADKMLSPSQKEALAAQFRMRHGGGNRGNVAVVEGGATINRLALNLQEMDISALRRIPETRICAAFRVPPQIVGVWSGLERSTYSNMDQASLDLTQRTFVPMWKDDAREYTAALGDAFGMTVEYDLSKVAALQEGEDAKYGRVLNAWDSGVITKNEARQAIGLPKIGELQLTDPGDVFVDDAPAMPDTPPIIDVQPIPPPQLTDEQKARGFKARSEDRTRAIERRMQRTLRRYFREQAEAVMQEVRHAG